MKQGWEIKKLGEVCNVINGLWVGKKEPFINIAVIRNTNFSKDCQLQLDNVAFIDVEVKQFSTRKLLQGDIIIEKSGGSDKQPVGRVVLFNIIDGNYSFSNFTSVLRIKSTVPLIPNFLHKCLYEYYIKGETIKLQSKTTGLRNLNMHAYLRLNIPVPPLSEQERIVAELDLLSDVIAKKREQLKQLDTLAQYIFYDMFGDPITNEKGWETKKLGDVFQTTSGGTPAKGHNEYYDNGNIPWLRSGEINKMYIYDTELFITELGLRNSSARWFPKNTVVIAMYGATVGQVGILCKEMTTNQAVCGILPNDEFIPIYIYHFLFSKKREYIEIAAGGAQPNISQNIIRNTLMCCPPLPLQQQFASKIEAIEKQKELIKQSLSEVQQLFDSRMDYYFG